MGINLELTNEVNDRKAAGECTSGSACKATLGDVVPIARSKGLGFDIDAITRGELQYLVQSVFLARDNGRRQVVFCGVDDTKASSWICARAAEFVALQSTGAVCLIDAKHGGLPISSSIDENPRPRDSVQRLKGNLWLLTETVGVDFTNARKTQTFRNCLQNLSTEFEYVVIDAPPISVSGDAALMGHLSHGLVLIVEARLTRRAAALKAKERIEAADCCLLGTVLCNRTFPIPETLYRYL